MKRKLFVFALALGLLLAGCAGAAMPGQTLPRETLPKATQAPDPFNSPEPMPGFDADNRYIMWYSSRLQEVGDTIFGGSGVFMRYYDRASGVSGVLCPNPECTHDSVSCGAYIDLISSLAYYNGKRYWVSGDPQQGGVDFYLWRSDLTGGNREKLKHISFRDVIMEYKPQWFAIHRGRLYFLGRAATPMGDDISNRMRLMYTSLDSSEEYTAVFDETYPQSVEMTVRFVNNAIYCAALTFSTHDLTVTKYDRETGTAETLLEEAGCAERIFKLWVTEGGTPYLGGIGDDRLTVWKLENGQKTEVLSRQGEGAWVELMGDVAVCNIWKDGRMWAEVFALTDDGISEEKLYEGWLFPETIPGVEGDPNKYSRIRMGGDADKIFLQLLGRENDNYTVMLDIRNGMKATLLWCNEKWGL